MTTTWIRRTPRGGLDRLTLPWHIEGPQNQRVLAEQGVCGESLGDSIDIMPAGEEPDLGDRCPVCQGAHARGDA